MPVQRLRGQQASVGVDVLRCWYAAEPLTEFTQEREQLLSRCEASRYEPCLPFRRVPAAEVLDHRLGMHGGLRIVGELAHRRRAPQPFGTRFQLGEDLIVGIALPNTLLERGQRVAIDTCDCAVDPLPRPRHTKKHRATALTCKPG